MEIDNNQSYERRIYNLSSVINKLKTKEEAIFFCQENGNFIFIYLDMYLPREKCYDVDYVLLVGAGKKKVS